MSNKDRLLEACWYTLGQIIKDDEDIKCIEFLIQGRPLIKKNGKNFSKGNVYGNKNYEEGKDYAMMQMQIQKNLLRASGISFPIADNTITQLMYGYDKGQMADVSNLCEAYHDFAQELKIIDNDKNIATTLPCIRVKSDSCWTRLRIFYGKSINKIVEAK
jgi:hypothetical protein